MRAVSSATSLNSLGNTCSSRDINEDTPINDVSAQIKELADYKKPNLDETVDDEQPEQHGLSVVTPVSTVGCN